MKPIRNVLKHPLFVPLASLSVLILVIILFLTQDSDSGVTLGLRAQKEGVLQYQVPETIIVGQPFEIKTKIDTQGNRINAAGLVLLYDPERIQVTAMHTRSSFCQFYPERKFDNRLGKITLSCGSPHPGFSGVNEVMSLEITPKLVGNTVIYTTTESRLLLSDGKGTDILNEYPQINLSILSGL